MANPLSEDMARRRAHEFFIEEFLTLFATSLSKADGIKLLNLLRADADRILQTNLETDSVSVEMREIKIDLSHREHGHITRIIDLVNNRMTPQSPAAQRRN